MPTQNYPLQYHAPLRVTFTREVFAVNNPALRASVNHYPALFFLEENLSRVLPQLVAQSQNYFTANQINLVAPPILCVGGEIFKDGWTGVEKIIAAIIKYNLCRHSFIFAAGGGAFLDVVGFAASLVHRGIRLVRLPTTALAQGDSGVGVKTGINFAGQKNLLGTFAVPFAVINDLNFLATLPLSLKLDGIAEAFKVAIIKDAEFFTQLENAATALAQGVLPQLENAIIRSAHLHAQHIAHGGDPFEQGSARPLDFGHWSAHWLEAATNFQVRHGEAVAIGMALDALIAEKLSRLTSAESARILSALKNCGFKLWHAQLANVAALTGGLENFRQHLGGELTLIFPHGIGKECEIHKLDLAIIEFAIKSLREKFA